MSHPSNSSVVDPQQVLLEEYAGWIQVQRAWLVDLRKHIKLDQLMVWPGSSWKSPS